MGMFDYALSKVPDKLNKRKGSHRSVDRLIRVNPSSVIQAGIEWRYLHTVKVVRLGMRGRKRLRR